MTKEKQLDKKINNIIQLKGTYPEELEITKTDYLELCKENMSAKEQFLDVKGNEVYFRNIKLKIKG